jgi:hypothetical protein
VSWFKEIRRDLLSVPCLLSPLKCAWRAGFPRLVQLYSASPSHVTTLLFLTPPPSSFLSSPPKKSTARSPPARPPACLHTGFRDGGDRPGGGGGSVGHVFTVVGLRRQQLGGRRRDRAAVRAAAAGGGQRAHRGGAARAADRAILSGQERRGLHLPQARMRARPRRPVLRLLRVRRKRPPAPVLRPFVSLAIACSHLAPRGSVARRGCRAEWRRAIGFDAQNVVGGGMRANFSSGWRISDSSAGNERPGFGVSSCVALTLANQRVAGRIT